jgi:hypothetical protein
MEMAGPILRGRARLVTFSTTGDLQRCFHYAELVETAAGGERGL